MSEKLRIYPKSMALALTIVSLAFAAATVVDSFVRPPDGTISFTPVELAMSLLNADHELSIPTWFSVVLLVFCGLSACVKAAVARRIREPYRHYWVGLAVMFFAFSLDEVAGVHEYLVYFVGAIIPRTGIFTYGWVVVAIPLVVLVAGLYLRFWLYLDVRTRWLFALAAALYVGGSLGMEMVGGVVIHATRGPSVQYAIVIAVEELGEMLGAIVFLYAQLSHLGRAMTHITLTIDADPVPVPLAPRSTAKPTDAYPTRRLRR